MSFKECGEHVLALSNQCFRLKQKYDFADDDIREITLSNCRGDCLYALAILNILCASEERRLTSRAFRGLIGMTGGSLQEFGNMMEKVTRLSFVTMYQFQVDSLYRRLLGELNVNARNLGYYTIVERLCRELRIENATEKLRILNVPAMIRTSLHANGTHHGYKGASSIIEIAGIHYEFIDGEIVICAGWEHICTALSAGLVVLEEVLDSPRIASITDVIFVRG